MTEAFGEMTLSFPSYGYPKLSNADKDDPETVKCQHPVPMRAVRFRETLMEDFVDLLKDSDFAVQVKSLLSVARILQNTSCSNEPQKTKPIHAAELLIPTEVFDSEVMTNFLALLENVVDDQDGTAYLASHFGEIVYYFHKMQPDRIVTESETILGFFEKCCYHKVDQIREHTAYYFVCIFKIFVKQQFDFAGCLLHLSRPQEEL